MNRPVHRALYTRPDCARAAAVISESINTRVVWQVVKGPAEWVGTKIRFELKQEDDFTIVQFRHEGWKEPVQFMYHCSTKVGDLPHEPEVARRDGQGPAQPERRQDQQLALTMAHGAPAVVSAVAPRRRALKAVELRFSRTDGEKGSSS